MTKQEQRDIKAEALLRYQEAKTTAACHRKKLSTMTKAIERAARQLRKLDALEVVIVNDRHLLSSWRQEIEYPSNEELVSEFQQYRQALAEEAGRLQECKNLGVPGL